MSVWKSDETLDTVFHHQMKHLEVRDETLHLKFDILHLKLL